MSKPIGWRAALPEILEAGTSVRRSVSFDEHARKIEVETLILAARRFPLWIPVVAVAALLVPDGWAITVPLFAAWGVLIVRTHRRGEALEARLLGETKLKRAESAREAQALKLTLAVANGGDIGALRSLSERWLNGRPSTIARFEAELSVSLEHGVAVTGRAVSREEIVQVSPRIGRGGKTFYDKRKAADIDEDLSEINAAAVLSLLTALFSGPNAQSVLVQIDLTADVGVAPVPWVSLDTRVDDRTMRALSPESSAVEAIRRLGGDVGHCRSQRLTAARVVPRSAEAPAPIARDAPMQPVTDDSDIPSHVTAATESAAVLTHASYAAGGVTLDFGDAGASDSPVIAKVPPAPERIANVAGGTIPMLVNVRGQFARVARKFADYPGIPGVPLAPFQAYWATYANMDAKQLEYYFSWRGVVRRGETPPTNLSYIFVHTCELLHLIGASDAADATRQLQRLWLGYRSEFPKLDLYLVEWIADLYALEIDIASAISFMSTAVADGAEVGKDEMLLVTDLYWSKSEYQAMPRSCVSDLVGDARVGSNKFYVEYNANGWLDRAYRETLIVTDLAYSTANGKSVRDATLVRDGFRMVSREAFRGAVYDWKRKEVVFGRVPSLEDKSLAVQLYRNAVRYSENLLRREKNFPSKLRGITIPADVGTALTSHFAAFVRATRPKPHVNIDFAKAAELSRDSEDVRARLLAGLDDTQEAKPDFVDGAMVKVPVTAASPSSREVPAGLLTDLDGVKVVFGALSEPARMILQLIARHGWEVEDSLPLLSEACSGVLLAPLIDEINAKSQMTLRQALIVREESLLVLQEDLRDEVYWVIEGSLEGFVQTREGHETTKSDEATPAVTSAIDGNLDFGVASTDGFEAAEIRALHILASGEDVLAELSSLATASGLTPLILLDRINEIGLTCSCGDLIVDCDAPVPVIRPDAAAYVEKLLERTHSLVPTVPTAAALVLAGA